MKKINILLVLIISFIGFSQSEDEIAVKNVLRGYIDAIYQSDSNLVYAIADSSLQKSGHYFSRKHQSWSYENMDFDGLVETAKTYNQRGWIPPKAPRQIEVFEVRDKVASAKVSAIWGFDYILLSKQEDNVWKINKVLWQSYTQQDIWRIQLQRAYADSSEILELKSLENHTSNIYRPSWDPSRRTLYFFQKEAQRSYSIYKSVFENNQFGDTEKVFLGDTTASNMYPAISPDGQRLVFVSYRNNPAGYKTSAYLWMSLKRKGNWSKPEFLKNLNKEGHYYSNLTFTSSGKLIYRETAPNWNESWTYCAEPTKNSFEGAKLYSSIEKWKAQFEEYHLWGGIPNPTENMIILDVSMIASNGKKLPSDQWISVKNGEKWSAPRPLGKGINREESWDTFPFFDPKGDSLYFVRDFESLYAIPVSKILN